MFVFVFYYSSVLLDSQLLLSISFHSFLAMARKKHLIPGTGLDSPTSGEPVGVAETLGAAEISAESETVCPKYKKEKQIKFMPLFWEGELQQNLEIMKVVKNLKL